MPQPTCNSFFFFNDTATTEIYTLSLHDALPISSARRSQCRAMLAAHRRVSRRPRDEASRGTRSEEHTSELQSQSNLVCRLLLEKKKDTKSTRLSRLQELRRSVVRARVARMNATS